MSYVEIVGNFRDKYTFEWAGTGKVKEGRIECSAVLGSDQDESDDIYSIIEDDIEEGLDSGKVSLSDGTEYRWSITEAW